MSEFLNSLLYTSLRQVLPLKSGGEGMFFLTHLIWKLKWAFLIESCPFNVCRRCCFHKIVLDTIR